MFLKNNTFKINSRCKKVNPKISKSFHHTKNFLFRPPQRFLTNLIGLSVIPNMEIQMKWSKHLWWWLLWKGGGSGRPADKLCEYKLRAQRALRQQRHMEQEGGTLARFLCEPCVVLGLKLGTLSSTNCALVVFMNIHSGVFRPRLISREIEEETRTFYHKRNTHPPSLAAFSRGCWQSSPSSLAKKERGKKLPEKNRTI